MNNYRFLEAFAIRGCRSWTKCRKCEESPQLFIRIMGNPATGAVTITTGNIAELADYRSDYRKTLSYPRRENGIPTGHPEPCKDIRQGQRFFAGTEHIREKLTSAVRQTCPEACFH